jgi:hypothetical protein
MRVDFFDGAHKKGSLRPLRTSWQLHPPRARPSLRAVERERSRLARFSLAACGVRATAFYNSFDSALARHSACATSAQRLLEYTDVRWRSRENRLNHLISRD